MIATPDAINNELKQNIYDYTSNVKSTTNEGGLIIYHFDS